MTKLTRKQKIEIYYKHKEGKSYNSLVKEYGICRHGVAYLVRLIYACVRILSESIASLPIHIYQYKDNGSKTKAIEHPLKLYVMVKAR